MDKLFILQLINRDFFAAFGLYSLVFLIVSSFIKKPVLKKVDEATAQFTSFIGIVYLIVWIIGIGLSYKECSSEETRSVLVNRMFGKYWFGYWLQPSLWVLLTQLLRFKSIRKNIVLRIIFSILFVISIESSIIIIISLHRDYLPASWLMYSDLDIYPSNFIVAILLKVIVFLIFTGIFNLLSRELKKGMQKMKSL